MTVGVVNSFCKRSPQPCAVCDLVFIISVFESSPQPCAVCELSGGFPSFPLAGLSPAPALFRAEWESA